MENLKSEDLDGRLIKDAQKALQSHFTVKYISKYTRLSYTTVNELKNEKRSMEKTAFKNVAALAKFYYRHKQVIEDMTRNEEE